MDQVIMLLFIIGLIVLPIIIAITQKDSFTDTEDDAKSYDSDDYHSAVTTSNNDDEFEEVWPSLNNKITDQITIYSLSAMPPKNTCPYCDGENAVGTTVCDICKRAL